MTVRTLAVEGKMSALSHVSPVSSAHRLPFLTLALLGSVLAATSCGDDVGFSRPDTLENWSLSAEPSVVIGGADERQGYLLHYVVGATRLGDGRIVVANLSSLELKYYDLEGRHLFDAGGRGEGPGEFQSFEQLTRLPGDSILVLS